MTRVRGEVGYAKTFTAFRRHWHSVALMIRGAGWLERWVTRKRLLHFAATDKVWRCWYVELVDWAAEDTKSGQWSHNENMKMNSWLARKREKLLKSLNTFRTFLHHDAALVRLSTGSEGPRSGHVGSGHGALFTSGPTRLFFSLFVDEDSLALGADVPAALLHDEVSRRAVLLQKWQSSDKECRRSCD